VNPRSGGRYLDRYAISISWFLFMIGVFASSDSIIGVSQLMWSRLSDSVRAYYKLGRGLAGWAYTCDWTLESSLCKSWFVAGSNILESSESSLSWNDLTSEPLRTKWVSLSSRSCLVNYAVGTSTCTESCTLYFGTGSCWILCISSASFLWSISELRLG